MSIADGKGTSDAQVKSVAELEGKPGGVVGRWVAEIGLASRTEKNWREECEGYWQLYRGGGEAGVAINQNINRAAFPILWTNTETMRPAVFNSVPKPDVRRRYRDDDPLGKAVSDVVERALEFTVDTGGLYEAVKAAALDMCVPGRGLVRVRYAVITAPIEPPGEVTNQEDLKEDQEATAEIAKQGGTSETQSPAELKDGAAPTPEHIVSESVEFEHVQWDDFRRGPGKTWHQVKWEAFRHRFDYDELVELVQGGLMAGQQLTDEDDNPMTVKELVDKIPLDSTGRKSDSTHNKAEEESVYQAAEVWEVWDKTKRKVLWICEGYKRTTLRTDPDPLKLRDFFCTPRPARLIEDPSSLIPTPVYRMYRDQARELELVCKRIDKITDALRIRGLYHPGLPEVEQLLEASDNEMIPVTNTSTLAQMKSLDDAIWIMPVEKLAAVLQQLYTARQQIVNVIYQITGISDIMRGDTKASETLGAQEIKSQWGTVRLQRVQREVERFVRDLICLASEVICTRFQLQTLKSMTGLPLPMQAELQQAQAIVQKAQQLEQQVKASGQDPQRAMQNVPPQMIQQFQQAQDLLKNNPISWEMVLQVMHSDMLMQYKVDIESDSTVAHTLNADMMGIQQVLTGISQFITAYGPAIQQGFVPMAAAKEIIMAVIRRARLGRPVEDAFDQIGQDKPKDPTPQEMAQLNATKDHLIKVAQDIAKRHEAQAQQLMSTDATVLQSFQKMQDMENNFAQFMEQAVAHLNMQQGVTQNAQELAPVIGQISQEVQKFQQALAQAMEQAQQSVTAQQQASQGIMGAARGVQEVSSHIARIPEAMAQHHEGVEAVKAHSEHVEDAVKGHSAQVEGAVKVQGERVEGAVREHGEHVDNVLKEHGERVSGIEGLIKDVDNRVRSIQTTLEHPPERQKIATHEASENKEPQPTLERQPERREIASHEAGENKELQQLVRQNEEFKALVVRVLNSREKGDGGEESKGILGALEGLQKYLRAKKRPKRNEDGTVEVEVVPEKEE